jgi:hypothetical protein
MQLMRHESIDTAMRFYVGRSVEAATEVLWEAYRNITATGGLGGAEGKNQQYRDTYRDTPAKSAQNDEEPPDVSSTHAGS